MQANTSLAIFIFLISGLACLNSIRAETAPLYKFSHGSPPCLREENAEISNSGTPDEEMVVKGFKVYNYLEPSNSGDYHVYEKTEYMADKNGNKVDSRFKLRLSPVIARDRLGLTALISTVGSASG